MFDKISHTIKNNTIRITLACLLGILVISCASIGSPSGGEYDFDPPVVLRSNPKPNQLHVKGNKIEIIFDELVSVEKPLEKVIVTPPQQNFPVIRSQNNKVIVELKDTLLPNTTYTIDFTDAIVDYNEQNPLENFALSFSTGDVIDSLAISGKVLSAENLEPVSGIYVGIHSNLSDTAFTKLPFLRISRTNELGIFTIKGVAPGSYKIYALNDINRDYRYDSPEEAIAFYDSIIIPSIESTVRYDSVFNIKTLAFDSLKEVKYNKLRPDDIILRSFTFPFKRQYLQKHERQTDDLLTIYFGAATQKPQVEAIGIDEDMKEWSVLERTAGNDTLKYWLTRPDIVQTDTINLKVSYFMTDTLNQLQPKTDTLRFVNRNKKPDKPNKDEVKKEKKKKGKEKDEADEVKHLTTQLSITPTFDIYRDIDIEFEFPVVNLEKEKLKLYNKPDSVFQEIDYEMLVDTLNPRKLKIKYNWKADAEYRLAIDSGILVAHNGLSNEKIESDFRIKNLDQYGSLDLVIHNLPKDIPAFVELLDKSDNPVKKAKVENDVATFLYLDPGIYYARLILDRNNNGKWDPGDYDKGIAPEEVYYYDKSFDIKAFWDLEEDWDILRLPLDKQKPLDITKNKPKDNDKRKREMEKRDAANSKRNNNSTNNTNNSLNNGVNTVNGNRTY